MSSESWPHEAFHGGYQLCCTRDFWLRLRSYALSKDNRKQTNKHARTCLQQPDKDRSKQAMDALEQLWRFFRSRRLAVSQKGMLGMVPNPAKKGDIVYILLGCDVPTLVRADEGSDTVRIGGSCYLHGVMTLDVMGFVDQGLIKIQTVSIR